MHDSSPPQSGSQSGSQPSAVGSRPRQPSPRWPSDFKRILFGLMLLTVMAATHATAQGAPDAYDRLLSEHVDAEGFVDYAGLAADERTESALAEMLGLWRATRPLVLSQDEELALLLNTYNAAVLKALLDAGAGTSGRAPSLLSLDHGRVFQVLRFDLGRLGSFSLADLEEGWIAQRAVDDRYRFALCSGAVSSPPLRAEAYTGEKLQEQLDDQRARTLSTRSPRFLRWRGEGVVEVTKAMEGHGDIARCLNEHADLPGQATDIRFLEFDWSLNAQARQSGTNP